MHYSSKAILITKNTNNSYQVLYQNEFIQDFSINSQLPLFFKWTAQLHGLICGLQQMYDVIYPCVLSRYKFHEHPPINRQRYFLPHASVQKQILNL